jgi:hypothetical protein
VKRGGRWGVHWHAVTAVPIVLHAPQQYIVPVACAVLHLRQSCTWGAYPMTCTRRCCWRWVSVQGGCNALQG